MELVFGYLAGLLTLLNPCVLPVLPVILIAALNQHKLGPVALCAGLSVTFVTLGLGVATLGPAFGIDDITISRIASVVMIAFGMILLVPQLSSRFSMITGDFSNTLTAKTSGMNDSGLNGQFMTGILLGAVWSPCIGPTLGGAISLASQGNNIAWAGAIMISFALGVSSIILLLAMASREALFRNRDRLARLSRYAKPITGILLVLLGLFLFFELNHAVDRWAIQTLPHWLLDLSVRF